MSKNNIFIFVADAMRYDYVPDSIKNCGTLVPTLAPSLYTPTSFASLATAIDAENHNVRKFSDILNKKTAFDIFPNGGYYDHPDDAMIKVVFRNSKKAPEISDLKEPFLVIERAMESHMPYGKIKHGNSTDGLESLGADYLQTIKNNVKSNYRFGIKEVEKHFLSHVNELDKMDMLDNTIVIFTSDHGELLGEKYLSKNLYGHSFPPIKELAIVPTVFYNMDLDIDFMRTIDIIPTCLGMIPNMSMEDVDGVDTRKNKVTIGKNFMHSPMDIDCLALNSIWKYNNDKIEIVNKMEINIKSLLWAISNMICLKILKKGFWDKKFDHILNR